MSCETDRSKAEKTRTRWKSIRLKPEEIDIITARAGAPGTADSERIRSAYLVPYYFDDDDGQPSGIPEGIALRRDAVDGLCRRAGMLHSELATNARIMPTPARGRGEKAEGAAIGSGSPATGSHGPGRSRETRAEGR